MSIAKCRIRRVYTQNSVGFTPKCCIKQILNLTKQSFRLFTFLFEQFFFGFNDFSNVIASHESGEKSRLRSFKTNGGDTVIPIRKRDNKS